MSSSITLKVATLTTSITFASTDQQVGNVLRYFVEDWAAPPADGLTQQQINQYYLDQAAARMAEMVRTTARRNRLRDLQAASTLEQQADSDTAL